MIIIVMGVAGAGKTTVGLELARRLGWRFVDADDLHPSANREKIARGEPLDDLDRAPWLDALGGVLAECQEAHQNVVTACSALRQAYRDQLTARVRSVVWVHLRLDPAAARERLAARRGHFASPALVESQFATLEPPPAALVLDAASDVESLVSTIVSRLGPQLQSRGSVP